MGIRFLCDSCQKKINVKDFLAGKRGVCPHCGESVRIPMESTLPAKSKSRVPAGATASTNSAPQPAPASVPVGATVPSGVPVGSVPQPQAQPQIPIGSPVAQAPATPAVPQGVPVGAPAQPVGVPVGAPVQPAPAPTPAADPLDEAPDANWYVRPPAGGQYGPAKADIFRKWLGEGRVTADSLVWRDGWTDWQTAGPLFPELDDGTSASATAGPTNGTPMPAPTSLVKSAAKGRPASRRRKKNNSTVAVVIVVMLVLISIALVVTLLFVLQNQTPPEDTSWLHVREALTSTQLAGEPHFTSIIAQLAC